MANLDSSQGLIVGEAVMMDLAPIVGRNAAHDFVYACCKGCIEDTGSTLFQHLSKRQDVTVKIPLEELAKLCDPRNYLSTAQLMVDDVLRSSPRDSINGKSANGRNGVANGYH